MFLVILGLLKFDKISPTLPLGECGDGIPTLPLGLDQGRALAPALEACARYERPSIHPPENVQEDKRKTFLNHLNFPTCPPKLCQNEAQGHSFLGAKDEPCSCNSAVLLGYQDV